MATNVRWLRLFWLLHYCLFLESNHRLLNVGFKNLNITFEVLLKSKYFEWKASLGSMVVQNPDEEKSLFPTLFQPQQVQLQLLVIRDSLLGSSTYWRKSETLKTSLEEGESEKRFPYVIIHYKHASPCLFGWSSLRLWK